VTMVHKEDLIAVMRDIARLARRRTLERFAEMPCSPATRRRLDFELSVALDQFDRQVENRIRELRGPGHA
jgi:hypothetical protein